ncbi:TetR/AcrR family transcriptional regulator [Streptacidiphilus sp. ASG 303]|uniref:TetR/AcrR family transcriptional regulator n=1 Tax=Streptacidiphilus sp. ASG 303 TaxID=2896847 RepID=UPI001E31B573|nr:TetR/AcrR family transcriptional regulator [Streptacidiphilus sp. ASG 303]MCD0480871.1 TetR/AcrR family transcriptional regulator [Streptacidiphilus sp. ASG 303]
MASRGTATRTKLVDTTIRLVGELGYAKTTTRAIAQAAGVAEGTLYRHFPDKAALFAEAVLQQNQHVVDWIETLPARAGTATVKANLTDCLTHLAALRADILPLELAVLTDPELARVAPPPGALPGPPGRLAEYLRAEQGLGRLRADADPEHSAVVLLALLFGMAMNPPGPPDRHAPTALPGIADAVDIVLKGLEPRTP